MWSCATSPSKAVGHRGPNICFVCTTEQTTVGYIGFGLGRLRDSERHRQEALELVLYCILAIHLELTVAFADVTIVSPTNAFNFTPLLASCAVGTLEFRCAIEPVGHITLPLYCPHHQHPSGTEVFSASGGSYSAMYLMQPGINCIFVFRLAINPGVMQSVCSRVLWPS
jgi:hypothetical protein